MPKEVNQETITFQLLAPLDLIHKSNVRQPKIWAERTAGFGTPDWL